MSSVGLALRVHIPLHAMLAARVVILLGRAGIPVPFARFVDWYVRQLPVRAA